MSGTHGIFSHRTGYFYTILEEDFCEVFKGAGKNEVCRAYITSILEHLTNKHYDPEKHGETIWVYMSLPEMARRMRNAYSERTIHKEIQGMIADGFMEKRRAAGKATMEYRLNAPKIAHALAHLPEKQPCNSATYHLAVLQEPSSKTATSILQNDKVNLAELQPRYTSRLPKDIPVEQGESIAPTYTQPAPLSDIAIAHPTPLPVSVFADDENAHDEADRAVIAHMLSQQGNPDSVFYMPPAPLDAPTAPQADIAAPQEDNAVTVTTEPLGDNPIATAPASITTKKNKRATSEPKEPKITQAQIDRVFETMNEALRSSAVYGQPDFSLVPSRKATEEVKQLIKAKALPSVLKAVILDMWNEFKNGEFWWRLPGRMTVPAICGQYSSRAPSLMPKVKLVAVEPDVPTAERIVDVSQYVTPLMKKMRATKAAFEARQLALQQRKG